MLEALFELVARFVVEFLFYTVFYGIGWAMSRQLRLGAIRRLNPQNTTKNSLLYFRLQPSSSGLRSRFHNSVIRMNIFALTFLLPNNLFQPTVSQLRCLPPAELPR
jgi:hypothetical protein